MPILIPPVTPALVVPDERNRVPPFNLKPFLPSADDLYPLNTVFAPRAVALEPVFALFVVALPGSQYHVPSPCGP